MQGWIKSVVVTIPIVLLVAYGIVNYGKEIDMFFGTTSASNYLLVILILAEVSVSFLSIGWIRKTRDRETWMKRFQIIS